MHHAISEDWLSCSGIDENQLLMPVWKTKILKKKMDPLLLNEQRLTALVTNLSFTLSQALGEVETSFENLISPWDKSLQEDGTKLLKRKQKMAWPCF
jgi:hypothetical protein